MLRVDLAARYQITLEVFLAWPITAQYVACQALLDDSGTHIGAAVRGLAYPLPETEIYDRFMVQIVARYLGVDVEIPLPFKPAPREGAVAYGHIEDPDERAELRRQLEAHSAL